MPQAKRMKVRQDGNSRPYEPFLESIRLQPAVVCADVRDASTVAFVVSSDNGGPERRWPAD